MTDVDRLADCTRLSLAAVAVVLAACSSGSGNAPDTAALGAGGSVAVNAASGGTTPLPGAGGVATTSPGSGGFVSPGAGGSIVVPPGAGGATTTPAGSGGATMLLGAGGATTTPPVGAGGSPIPPAGSGGAAPGAAGSAGNGNGTANGTADDMWTVTSNLDQNGLLIAPTADQGFQTSTPVFTLEPGQEVFKCYHTAFTNNAEFDVGDWESQMSPGSHHFILYKTDTDFVGSGTLDSIGCTILPTGGQWIYSAAVPHTHLAMPVGVAMPLAAGQKVQFDMHYINTGADPLQAHVTLNVLKVKGSQFQKAQSQVSFNTSINIPPNGMQTVGGDCPPAPGANYFMMLTHTHRRGIDASITRKLANGQLGEVLVHTTNWDSPQNILWENPPYLTFNQGEKFHYRCEYQNDRPTNTTVGISATDNEMCMAITYFFPSSGTAPPQCTSDVE